MKVITYLGFIVLAGAVPGFCQTPRHSLASLFNSNLAFYFPSPDSTPISTGVLNAGSGAPAIAANTWLSVYGTNLAQTTTDWSNADFSKGLPTSLGGVSATVDGLPAAVYYISPTQVNILAPIDNNAKGPVPVVVTTQYGKTSVLNPVEQNASPAFFVIDGSGHVAARHLDYSLIGPSTISSAFTPAKPGETVLLYSTGFGQTIPPITDQLAGSGPLPTLPTLTIGGLPAQVTFAGLSAAGLFQFNVVVPTSAPNGDLAIVCQYTGLSTQTGVVLTVHN